MDENTSYSDGAITVDADYVRIGQRSFLIDEITGLKITTTAPHKPLWGIVGIGAGLYVIVTQIISGHHFQAFVVGALLLAGGYWQFNRSRIRIANLTIYTQAHPEPALSSRDPERVRNLRDAIERARAARR